MLTVDALVEAELFDEPLLKPSVAVCRTLPAKALVELYYLDYLGRAADPEAATSYGRALESNAIGIDDLRNQLLHSEEFRRRDIRPHHRLGRGTMISALSVYERAPFGKHAPLKQYEHLSAVELAASDNSRFLEACYAKIIRRKPDRRTHQTLLGALEEARMSRLDVMRELVLQAGTQGRYVEIDDLPSAQAATTAAQSRISPEGALL
jgi:hypothetical protein